LSLRKDKKKSVVNTAGAVPVIENETTRVAGQKLTKRRSSKLSSKGPNIWGGKPEQKHRESNKRTQTWGFPKGEKGGGRRIQTKRKGGAKMDLWYQDNGK